MPTAVSRLSKPDTLYLAEPDGAGSAALATDLSEARVDIVDGATYGERDGALVGTWRAVDHEWCPLGLLAYMPPQRTQARRPRRRAVSWRRVAEGWNQPFRGARPPCEPD